MCRPFYRVELNKRKKKRNAGEYDLSTSSPWREKEGTVRDFKRKPNKVIKRGLLSSVHDLASGEHTFYFSLPRGL